MKIIHLFLIFAIGLICLFFLQASWLYYVYRLHLQKINESIDSIFYKAVEKELDLRFLELEKMAIESFTDADVRIDSFKIHSGDSKEAFENKSVVSQQFAMVQQLMEANNIHFNPVRVDSIFHSLLQLNQYPFSYQVILADSIGRILKTTGHEIVKGAKTIALPIVKGEETYAIVKVSAPTVFKKMLAILIVSILIFFFIIACSVYGIKISIDQHYLNRLRKNFTHALTHDMKTPLATIHSVLVQLEKGTINNAPDLRQKFNAVAIEQVLNLQTTVNRILTLASIEKRPLSLNKQPVDLPAMVQSLIDKFTIKSPKNISFQTFYDLQNSKVLADPYYLNNAISNLIDNAIKYSGDSVEIIIECTKEDHRIYIRIKDTGFGISLNDQLKIFKPFERGAEIKRNRISGFGIGLNYVQRVIEAHGGVVTLLSQEGIGSEFIITLPI